MASSPVYILGGAQSDFSLNWARSQKYLFDLMAGTVQEGLATARLDPAEIEVAHIGNFVGELFSNQGLLGGLFASIDPDFATLPTSRHEAACASGSVAALAATAEIEAGRYDLACVLGVELMRNATPEETAQHLAAAMWQGREFQGTTFVWPRAFSDIAEEYDRRYGLKYEHLARIAEINFENARRNPKAQTRKWIFGEKSFSPDDEANPRIEGWVRRQDCSQITDGAAVVFLASERRAAEYAEKRGMALADLPVIKGWGHRSSPMLLEEKLKASRGSEYVFPHVRAAISDAFARAGIAGLDDIDGIETHDCFTPTEYMAIDHFGITAPGEAWKAIESGAIERGGDIPINPSGGLIGCGHPVGATGVRMLLDASRQVTDSAGDCQIEGAKTFATLNIGGAATSVVSFVVGTVTAD